MKKAHIWLGLCLLLALALMHESPAAQESDPNRAGTRAMGEKIRSALVSGDYNTVYSNLRPAARGRVALLHEIFVHQLAESDFDDNKAAALAKDLDPSGKLAMQGTADLRALSEVDFFGLASGLLRFAATRKVEQASLAWHLVEQGTAYQSEFFGEEVAGLQFYTSGLAVAYANRAGEQIGVLFEREGGALLIVGFTIQAEDQELTLDALGKESGGTLNRLLQGATTLSAKRSEGEQLLGSARDYCRVEYSKTGDAAAVSKPFAELVEEGTFDGEYFTVREYHAKLEGAGYDAAFEAHPVEQGDGYGLIMFKWADGSSKIEWFDTKTQLDKRVEEIKEGPKIKEAK